MTSKATPSIEAEQLSMDFSSPSPKEEAVEKTYDTLDVQLADLMLGLNESTDTKSNKTLKYCVLEISQHTREGQIALSCTPEQQAELQKATVVGRAGDYKPLILDHGYLYLRRYWQYQQQLADQIQSRLRSHNVEQVLEEDLSSRLDHYFPSMNDDEVDWQRVAAESALHHDFLIISGGPGTGKTTTITRLLCLLIEQKNKQSTEHLKILLAAPTGKASIRMLDAINEAKNALQAPQTVLEQMSKKASTLHKMLGYLPEKVNFKHNKSQLLNADVVLVDEASMIDIAMMSKLIEALPDKAKLILIGDKNQLSSVETGSVFADMCEGLEGKLVTLQKSWRFEENSGIGQLAIAANKGDDQSLLGILADELNVNCSLLDPSSLSGNAISPVLTAPWQHYFEVLNNPNASISDIFKAFNQYRVLCALRRGFNGSTIISSRIEAALSQQGEIKLSGNYKQQGQSWYHGRPVMITQNSYSKGLFNGDTGITLIRNGELKVYFPDGEEGAFKSIAPVRLPAHETTWAMTIHKSQGSEFNEVALILPHEVMPLLTKQLIYTGITRAKQKVSIVASVNVLKMGIKGKMVQASQIASLLVRKIYK